MSNKWTKETALAVVKKSDTGTLRYCSALDYLVNHCNMTKLEAQGRINASEEKEKQTI